MGHLRSHHAQTLVVAFAIVATIAACGEDRSGRSAGGTGGAGGTDNAGTGGVDATAGFGGSGGFAGTGDTAGIGGSAGFGGSAGAAGAGGLGGVGGTAGSAGTGGMMMCPATFECVTDPIFGLLNACLPMGGMALPPECTTDADCIAAGLPEGICLSEEETGLTGCLQLCEP